MKMKWLLIISMWFCFGLFSIQPAFSEGLQKEGATKACESVITFPGDPNHQGFFIKWQDQNVLQAIRACEEAVKQVPNSAKLQLLYAEALRKGNRYSDAVPWYHKSAENGFSFAQLSLYMMYKDGNGVLKNKAKAFDWLRKSANQGNPISMVNLGNVYKYGNLDRQKDEQKAIKWYKKAEKKGMTRSFTAVKGVLDSGYNSTQNSPSNKQRKTAGLRSDGKMCRPPSATEQMPSHRGSREVKEYPGHYRTGPGSTTTSWYVWDPEKGGFYGEGYRPQDLVARDLLAACGRAGGKSCYRIGGCIGKHTDRAPFTTATVGIAIPKDRSWAFVGCAGNKPAAVQQAKRNCEALTGCECDATYGLDATLDTYGPKALIPPQRQSQSEDVLKDLNRYEKYTKKWWTIRCKNPQEFSKGCGCVFLPYQQERSDPVCGSFAVHRKGWCQQGHPRRCKNGCYSFFNKGHPNDTGPIDC